VAIKGVTGMARNWWNAKNLFFVVAIVLLACVTAVLAIGLVYPEPVSSAALGPDWQCSRLAFVWTTCSRLNRTKSASAHPVRATGCPLRRWL
jgi:hypothetical protein